MTVFIDIGENKKPIRRPKRIHVKNKVRIMLSRDCDGCFRKFTDCDRRFQLVKKGERVYCPDGTAHLIDQYKGGE